MSNNTFIKCFFWVHRSILPIKKKSREKGVLFEVSKMAVHYIPILYYNLLLMKKCVFFENHRFSKKWKFAKKWKKYPFFRAKTGRRSKMTLFLKYTDSSLYFAPSAIFFQKKEGLPPPGGSKTRQNTIFNKTEKWRFLRKKKHEKNAEGAKYRLESERKKWPKMEVF